MKAVAVAGTRLPMHLRSPRRAGSMPDCGMKLVPAMPRGARRSSLARARRTAGTTTATAWNGRPMPEIKPGVGLATMIWQLIDRQTGAVNGDISWSFTVGDRVRSGCQRDGLRPPDAPPFHVTRRAVSSCSRDGQHEPPTLGGRTRAAARGRDRETSCGRLQSRWAAHCHIAEHNQSGSMFRFNVSRRQEPAR